MYVSGCVRGYKGVLYLGMDKGVDIIDPFLPAVDAPPGKSRFFIDITASGPPVAVPAAVLPAAAAAAAVTVVGVEIASK